MDNIGRKAELEMAERHICASEARITKQREIVEKLRRGGHPTHEAKALLATFEKALASHRDRRALIIREIEGTTGPGTSSGQILR